MGQLDPLVSKNHNYTIKTYHHSAYNARIIRKFAYAIPAVIIAKKQTINNINTSTAMKYDFDKLTERRHTACVKWDLLTDDKVLPLWVADMDFEVSQPIKDAVLQRALHGIFGYVLVPDEYYQSVVNWFARRHNWHFKSTDMLCVTGVVPAVTLILKALTEPGDGVIIQPPVYNCFFTNVSHNDCRLVENNLIYENNTYRIDFEDLERKASDPGVKAMVVCNPHNPACRVWTREELERIAQICINHNVAIISDEIHCEFTYGEHHYTPMASLSPEIAAHTISCCSASKAFNIAGLHMANIVTANDEWRARIQHAIEVCEAGEANPFGIDATIAAFNHSEEWLEQMLDYVYGNYQVLKEFFEKNLPHLGVTKLEGTYLAWIDCQCLGKTSEQLVHELEQNAKVLLNSGSIYGAAGEGFLRVNMACPRSRLLEALKRMKPYLEQ